MTIGELKALITRHDLPDEAELILETSDGNHETPYDILQDVYDEETGELSVFLGCELLD